MYCLLLLRYVYVVVNPMLGCTTSVLLAIAICAKICLLLSYVYIVVNPMLGCTTSVLPAIAKICLCSGQSNVSVYY